MATTGSKVTIHMVSSLDGFIAKKDNSVSWLESTDTPIIHNQQILLSILPDQNDDIDAADGYKLSLRHGGPRTPDRLFPDLLKSRKFEQ